MIKICSYDKVGPEFSDNVASFDFEDPDNKENLYSLSYRFIGQNIKNPANWIYDGACYWDKKLDPKFNKNSILVPKELIEGVLNRHSTSLDTLLSNYISLIENPDANIILRYFIHKI